MTRYTRMGRSSSAVSVSWEDADVGTSSAHGGWEVRVDTVCPKQYSFSRGVVNWLSWVRMAWALTRSGLGVCEGV